MSDNAHLATPLDHGPVDLARLDSTLRHLRRGAQAAAAAVASMTEARDRLAAAPDDVETRHAARMAALHMRGEATALAQLFATLAQPEWATP